MNWRRERLRRGGACSLALALGTLLLAMAAVASDKGLERPPGLEPEIGFWRQIFAEALTNQYLIHDDRHLHVVYDRIDVPEGAGTSNRRRATDEARARYRRILETLAAGKRSGLTSDEKRVLGLWPEGVSNDELRAASRRVRAQQGLADRFEAGLARSGQWRDYIVSRLREQGVPEGLAALPHVESSFNPAARSHVGAAGLWQFTRSTGQRFMQIDHVVDGRRDPFISSDAAARLLSYNYSILEEWPLAVTAYNHGVAGMRRAVRDMGTRDIEAIVRGYSGRAFGFASRNFYVAFLAALEVEQNETKYFKKVKRLSPRPELIVTMPDYVPAAALADAFGIPVEVLRDHNPALLGPVWQGTKYVPRGFTLRVPVSMAGGETPARLMADVPGNQRYREQTPDLYHRIERGDSLSGIAARYRTSVSELMALNGLENRHRIRAGQVLRLPVSGGVQATAITAETEVYRVRSGDTLGEIAVRAGIDEAELMAMNGLTDRNRIYPGQQLALRPIEGAADAPAAEAAVVAERSEPEAAGPQPAPDDSAPLLPEPAAAAPATIAAVPAARPDPAPEAPASAIPEILAASEPALAEPPADNVIAVAESPEDEPDERQDRLLADPSDYLVSADGTIEVQAAETLGHYADWLDIRTQRLRDLNGYRYQQPLVIGQRLRLDFSRIDRDEFAARRVAHHRELQESFFINWHVAETTEHRMRSGESLWVLARQRYKVPVWLLRQYNPELNLDRVQPGERIVFPRIEANAGEAGRRGSLAEAS